MYMSSPVPFIAAKNEKLALQGPSICNTRKGEDKYKESRIIGSGLFPTGKMSGYENNINSILSPASGIWNLIH